MPEPSEEMQRLLDTPVVFGLRAQGHIPTIKKMLAAGRSWDAIGKEIGWDPDTAQRHYESDARDRLQVVAGELRGYRFSYGTERDLQNAIAEILRERWVVIDEHRLERGGRIDLYVRELRVGIEVKIEGAPGAVARQCGRYLASPDVDALLLVTRRARLRMPDELSGKPFAIVSLARDAL